MDRGVGARVHVGGGQFGVAEEVEVRIQGQLSAAARACGHLVLGFPKKKNRFLQRTTMH